MVPVLAVFRLICVLIDHGFCQSLVFTVPEHGDNRIELLLTSPSHLQLVNMFLVHSNDLGMGKCILPLNKRH